MSAHRIYTYNFEFWEGDPPDLPDEHLESFTRAGANGVGFVRIGRFGDPFTCLLTAHFPSYAQAFAAHNAYKALVALAAPVGIIYNGINLVTNYQVGHRVLQVQLRECQAHARLIGPGYDFPNGAKVVTEWRLQAVAL